MLLRRTGNNRDVRGNLGPASVVVQAKPGTDWIHDRWQAASDMHGSQIPGAHWIQLEFQFENGVGVVADRIILDWETAYADEYVLEASSEPFVLDGNANGDVQKRKVIIITRTTRSIRKRFGPCSTGGIRKTWRT